MQSFLSSIKPTTPPVKVLTVAEFAMMKGQVSLRELMRIMARGTRPRPFYLIAHMCNSISEAAEAMALGANAIELDINLPGDHTKMLLREQALEWEFVVRHPPTPVGVPIKAYLDDLAKLLKVNKHVALVYFDIKDANIDLMRLREIIRTHLTSVVPVQIILSHAAWEGRSIFNPIKQDTPGEGVMIDEDHLPSRVSDFFEKKGLTRFGYGFGVAVPGVDVDIPSAVMRGVAFKWLSGKIRWVCTYTLEDDDSMRDYIAKGVDGILVNNNNVLALKKVFNECAGKYRLRLAERGDDPFDPPVHPSYILKMKTAAVGGAGTDANLTFELRGSTGTVKTTIDAYPAGLFEAGDTNLVTLIGTDVGIIKDLTLSQDGVGDWTVADVIVQKRGAPDVKFDFFATIEPDQRVTRTPSKL